MQTFLPYADFKETARVLDYRRLGKQRVEAWQILRAMNGLTRGWTNHPATKMWNGFESALCHYAIDICDEWVRRGYKDTMTVRFQEHLQTINEPFELPAWIGNKQFHDSHKSNLIRKDPEFYQPLFPGIPNNLEYVWPSEFVLVA